MPQQKIEKVYLVIYKSIANTQAVEVFRKESKADERARELWIRHDQNVQTIEAVVK